MEASLHDDILIQRARKGDQTAFRMLVERYEASVRGIVSGMVGSAQAEDIAQEVFLKFYRSMHQFAGNAKLSTYLGRIAINTALTALDKRKRRPAAMGTDDLRLVHRADPSQSPERQELQDALKQALDRLSEEYRAVVVLRLVEGYSVSETAELLQIPMGTVASRLSRAQKELQQYLKPILR